MALRNSPSISCWVRREPAVGAGEALRDPDPLVKIACQPKILIGLKTGTGAVGAVFVDDQIFARHDVAQIVDHRLRHPWPLRRSAILRPSLDVLRPQPVQGEGMGPFGIALPVVPPFSLGRAIRRRPAEHEDVVVEASRLDPSLGGRLAQCQRGNQTEAEKTE